MSEMDVDTAILLALTTCAFGWLISFGIREHRQEVKAREQEEIIQLQRADRLRKLFDRT